MPDPAHPEEALTRAAALIKIIAMVSANPPGARLGRDELSFACGCQVRTIQRAIDVLKTAGIPIEYDRRSHSYTLPDKNWSFPVVTLLPQDVLALALAQGLLAAPGTPHQAALLATLDKATAGLPPALRTLLEKASAAVRPASLARDYSQAPLQPLIQAAAARHSVKIDYLSYSSGRSWRRVDPYAVEPRSGQLWELSAWDEKRGEIRTFALDRVLAMRDTGESFAIREAAWAAFAGASGVIGGLRGGSPEPVDVLFALPVAPYALARHWPDGLACAAQSDGSARLTGSVQGLDGICAELLRWRRHAQVLGGPALRERMREEIEAMRSLYVDPTPK
jgi:predicted DNA-binding transcriptional regulator YafY